MKKIFVLCTALMLGSLGIFAQGNKKEIKIEPKGINWISFGEAEQLMKKEPKKVIIDIYTDWCGWCKVLDKKTYSNPQLIDYVNKNFYAIKFNAEGKEPFMFMGKKWEFQPANRANELAIELMQGKMSYPTTVFMEKGFTDVQPVPGYLDVNQMEGILKFIGEDYNKKISWNDFQHQFKAAWKP